MTKTYMQRPYKVSLVNDLPFVRHLSILAYRSTLNGQSDRVRTTHIS